MAIQKTSATKSSLQKVFSKTRDSRLVCSCVYADSSLCNGSGSRGPNARAN